LAACVPRDRESRDRKRKSRWDSDDGVKLEDAAVDVEKLASKKAQQIYLLNVRCLPETETD
jgi:hypothetical protein